MDCKDFYEFFNNSEWDLYLNFDINLFANKREDICINGIVL